MRFFCSCGSTQHVPRRGRCWKESRKSVRGMMTKEKKKVHVLYNQSGTQAALCPCAVALRLSCKADSSSPLLFPLPFLISSLFSFSRSLLAVSTAAFFLSFFLSSPHFTPSLSLFSLSLSFPLSLSLSFLSLPHALPLKE